MDQSTSKIHSYISFQKSRTSISVATPSLPPPPPPLRWSGSRCVWWSTGRTRKCRSWSRNRRIRLSPSMKAPGNGSSNREWLTYLGSVRFKCSSVQFNSFQFSSVQFNSRMCCFVFQPFRLFDWGFIQ